MSKTFRYTRFHDHCLSYAEELLQEIPEPDEKPEIHRPAIGIVVLSAMGIEAAVNRVIEIKFRRMLERTQAAALEEKRDEILHETNPVQRLDRLADAWWGEGLDTGREPWQSAGDLYALRNAFVHYQYLPAESSEEGTLFPGRARLRNRAKQLGLWSIFEREGGIWLEVFLNRPCAQWAIGTAHRVVEALERPPWMGAREGE